MCHMTNVHPRTDIRIRVKEASSLAETLGVPVSLFVQDGLGDETDENGMRVIDTGLVSGGRLRRMSVGAWRMYRAVHKARPKVAHFHDPELIPVGLALKLSGIKVVYDIHEDVPRQIQNKKYLPALIRHPVAWTVEAVEWVAAHIFDGLVPATPRIAERFPAAKTVVVQNFPLLSEWPSVVEANYAQRPEHVAYVGGITRKRGAVEMIQALEVIAERQPVRLQLAGGFQPSGLEVELKALAGWQHVDYRGWASRPEVAQMLGQVRAGLVVLHPTANYPDAYPVKMFEYMAAGLPVIASDFPLWRQIVDGAGCGLLVDPLNPRAIAEAMQWLLDHPEEAEAMGRRGREAVERVYHWEPEAEKLLDLYRRLLGGETREVIG
ncbi:glycosyl transferase [Thioalkalivibrio paradoxus ARh 1]|uniref:Glycosyl transferase n=2 Tax=Thioalkalivibrio paradoxus TaxID=108010 RepID=W0DLU2_9GAMM|nr:glycosyl transferase [Thioalkalivibrio paradoxus ARh 1]